MPERGSARGAARLARGLRVATSSLQTALRALEGESVRLRAMALTYISLFALVPALVVAFSVVQAFTGMDRIAARVSEVLFENLAVGARATIEPYLQRFVRNAHLTSAGIVGGAFLVWSAVSLFSNVDRAVNDIWGIRRRRKLRSQAVIYWVGLTLGPLLLAASVMIAHSTRDFLASTGLRVLGTAGSVLLTCAFFAVLYAIVPDTKVRLGAAAAGGLAAGVAWELAKWGYTFAVARFFRYHAIYGSVAAVPTFLLWLFVSWAILLFGARLAFVVQYARLRRGAAHPVSAAEREILAGQALLAVARAYDRGAKPPDAGDVAGELSVQAEDVTEAVAALRQASLVVAVADGGLVPCRPLEKITLADVRRAVQGTDVLPDAPAAETVAHTVAAAEQEAMRRLAGVTFRELCDSDAPTPLPGQSPASEQPLVRPVPAR